MDNTALFRLSYGLYVVGVKNGESYGGSVVDAFAQVGSGKTPMVVISCMNTNNTNKATCLTTNWMQSIVPSDNFLWTISPLDSSSNYSFFVSGFTNFAGEVNYSLVINSPGVYPVLHLTPSITLTGDGTEGNPFQIMA